MWHYLTNMCDYLGQCFKLLVGGGVVLPKQHGMVLHIPGVWRKKRKVSKVTDGVGGS